MFFATLDSRYQLILRAYNDAKDAFRYTKRESGERYFEHLRAVSLILIDWLRIKDYRYIVVALLHDIVEDCKEWSLERLTQEYGQDIAVWVEWLTKPPKSEFGNDKLLRNRIYHRRLLEAPRGVKIIKLCDRLHNVMTLAECPPEKIKHKTEETVTYYLPLAEQEIILIHELEEALENLK